MKCLVIGGAGFIGSHLCEALTARGDETVAVDDLSLGNEKNLSDIMERDNFRLIVADATEGEKLNRIFADFRPDYVFHLAANSDIQASAKNPAVEYKNTYTTTFCVLDAMRQCGAKKIFFASTSAIYGDKREESLSETTPDLRPISYYGAAKLGAEALVCAFSYMNDFSSLIFRFPNVIGPHLTHGVIFDFINRLKKNPHELTILGDGQQTKPYMYVDDLINAILQFCEVPPGVTLYNLGVDSATSVTEIANIVVEEMGLSDVKFSYTGGEGGWKGDIPRFKYDLSKIHATGWRAKYDSNAAVRLTVQKYLASE